MSRHIPLFFLFPFLYLFSVAGYSQAGKDGAETISTAGVIFNRYTTLAASATAGSTSITVSSVAGLAAGAIAGAANNPYATASLGYGDLIMIIKVQGASINTTNTVSYGSVTATNNAGVYELKLVRSVSGNTIFFCSGLAYDYTVGGTNRVQVIRIPRLSALTVNGGASLTAPAWSSSFTGGIVAVEVNGNAAINGSVTVNGLGFRGGAVENNTSGAPGGPTNYVNSASTDGAEKGESIAGYQADYDALNGRYDRGAPANGGGGGNAHNAGGGGGANGNNGSTWTGQGVMVTNGSNPLGAWALDPGYIANGNALTTSSGGGRGGYSYGANNQVATTVAPGNTGWGGDNRREAGGLGGRPNTYAVNTLFMGGGGGAGDGNNSAAQNGANGAGIIYLLVTGNLSGTGSITANGSAAGPTISGHNDAPGGGGAGGAIRLNVQGTVTTSTITANGGAGGNQLITSNESEGPGGGGGGGYIRTTGTPTVSVNGASAGTTSSAAVTEFTFNGATSGAAGQIQNNQVFEAAPLLDCFPLPVHLISFEVNFTLQKEAVLSWVTEEESQLAHFIAEYSEDGRNWQMVAQLPARNLPGRQAYSLQSGKFSGTRYFRLKMVNLDNSAQFSAIRILSNQDKLKIVYTGSTVMVTGLTPAALQVILSDGAGRTLYRQQLSGQPALDIPSVKLTEGLYFLRVLYADGRLETMRLLK